jgi:NAD(P)-dependent dehydrogenase (short-subunit alcohol dehydrogenase family)
MNQTKFMKFIIFLSIFASSMSLCFCVRNKVCNRKYLNDEIRIDGKVVIITGGTSGLGLETAKNLANRGGTIYLASRGERKGLEAVESIKNETGNENVKFIQLDLGSLASIRKFSDEFHSIEKRLDILINNAGVVAQFNKTEDGFELNMGINHLGHFLLTNLLLDLLKASAPSRIIVVSSVLHYIGFINPFNLNSELYFPGLFKQYGNSKLATVLFTRELARRLKNTGVTVNSLDPGPSMSNVFMNLNPIFSFVQSFWRTPEHGSQSHVFLAVDPSVKNISGDYFLDCVQWFQNPLAYNEKLASWLWNESMKLTKFDPESI